MAVRFRKSVKLGPGVKINFSKRGVSTTIGPKGFTTSIGRSGVYRNVSIPGTGVSFRSKVGGRKSTKRTSSSTSRAFTSHASSSGETVPKAVRDWQAYTGKRNPGVKLSIAKEGEVVFHDETGALITDPNLIAIIKRTPQYKEQLPQIKERQRRAVANTVVRMEQENASFVKAYMYSPNVFKRPYYEAQLQRLQPKYYTPKPFAIAAPTPQDIQAQLSLEADQNVKGAPWKTRKLKEEYYTERYQDRFNAAIARWQADKAAFESSEALKASRLNAEYQEEYAQLKTSYEKALQGDAEYIEDVSEQWISSVELPVDIATQFEYRSDAHCLMVDLDLPEIEDLPTETAIQMANGSLKVKEKTQKVLRAEYAECVFGLAIFVAASLFNASPEIAFVIVSGYTQRRNKVGDIVDDYILSIKFARDGFYCIDFTTIDPEAFCLSFENRCNMTSTKMFKTIEPYD